ncbi:MAG: tetratricopeptide repeat protein [Acidobacteriota bacterium]
MSPACRIVFCVTAIAGAYLPAVAKDDARVELSEILEAPEEDVALSDALLDLLIDPADVNAHVQLANQYARQNELELAENAYRRALKLDRRNPMAWNNLGVLYLRQGRVGKAASCFEKAVDRDPAYALARYNLASILEVEGKYDQAVEHYRIAFHHRPDLTDVSKNPHIVLNKLWTAARLLNYVRREDYSLLLDQGRPQPRLRIIGIAEPAPGP